MYSIYAAFCKTSSLAISWNLLCPHCSSNLLRGEWKKRTLVLKLFYVYYSYSSILQTCYSIKFRRFLEIPVEAAFFSLLWNYCSRLFLEQIIFHHYCEIIPRNTFHLLHKSFARLIEPMSYDIISNILSVIQFAI